MPYSKSFIFFLLAAALVFTGASTSNAARIAILPVEDLSHGGNGVNFTTTHILTEMLRAKGFTIAEHGDVISFMTRNRVRWLGQLSSPYIRRLQEELEVEYLLLGSISQRHESPPLALNLTLQLIRTVDSQIVWCANAELSKANNIALLGLSSQMSMEEVEKQVVQQALLSMPDTLEPGVSGQSQHRIESVRITPQMVKPGEKIFCRIKLDAPPATLFRTTISVFIDDQIIDAAYDEGENTFIASWPSGTTSKRYTVWASISKDHAQGREIRVGNYQVDGHPPEVRLQVKGQELNGTIILQKKVLILPILTTPEPITSWEISVHDENGNQVMGEKSSQKLPHHFSWWGQSKTGELVQDGFYTLKITVWDRAGNSGTAQEAIRVVRTKPKLVIAMEKQAATLAVDLKYDGAIPLAYWRLQIRNKDGSIIAESNGTEHSESINLPLNVIASKNITYRLYAQDMLGNRMQRDAIPANPGEEEEKEQIEPDGNFLAGIEGEQVALGGKWVEDF